MTTVSRSGRRLGYVAAGMAIALAPALGVLMGSAGPAPRVMADCQEGDSTDSYSLSCTPSLIPDTSDQVTEEELAAPGYNANPHNSGHH